MSDGLQLPSLTHGAMLSDEVYQVLRTALLDHRIEPGEKLNLQQLARALHVSNTPIRQALGQLVAEGLVDQVPYRGFSAAPMLDMATVRQMYEYRLIVEPTAARLATERATAAQIELLLDLCDKAEQGGSAGRAQGDESFHHAIGLCTQNEVLVESLRGIRTATKLHTMYSSVQASDQAWSEHREVAQAIASRDPAEAAAAMRRHLSRSLRRMQDQLGR